MSLLSSYLERIPGVAVDGHSAALASSLADSILPDPLAAKDLVRADGKALAALIQRRECEERLPLRRALIRYPKNFDANAYRAVTSLDIVDQLAFRIAAGPCTAGHVSGAVGFGPGASSNLRQSWRLAYKPPTECVAGPAGPNH